MANNPEQEEAERVEAQVDRLGGSRPPGAVAEARADQQREHAGVAEQHRAHPHDDRLVTRGSHPQDQQEEDGQHEPPPRHERFDVDL